MAAHEIHRAIFGRATSHRIGSATLTRISGCTAEFAIELTETFR